MNRNKSFEIVYSEMEKERARLNATIVALYEMLELDGCRPGGERISDEYPREAKRVEVLFRRLRTE